MAQSSSSDELLLLPGQVISEKWKVISQLGKGGFGAVYKVLSAKGPQKPEYAMKIESTKDDEESMIKMEVAVLKTFRKQQTPPRHACQYYDNGETTGSDKKTGIRYVVMELLGPSLGDLRRSRPETRFSESTTVRLGLQCLECIEAVHRIGFIHRDIKPANFAMGRGTKYRVVYVLDYGLARQYITRDGELREPRKTAGFRGTVRYASINAHSRRDLGRHDDLWSLLYILVEFQRGELPWHRISENAEVGRRKKETVADQLLLGMPQEFHRIMNELFGLQYGDTPNYAWFYQQLKAIMIRKKYHETDPFDWEPAKK